MQDKIIVADADAGSGQDVSAWGTKSFGLADEVGPGSAGFFFASLAYLLIPALSVLFFFGPWPIAVLASGAMALFWVITQYIYRVPAKSGLLRGSWPYLLLAAAVTWLSGALPPFAENHDWHKHYAIFNALIEKPWPPVISTGDAVGTLRYYLGYYAFPAAIAKYIGWSALPVSIYVSTTLGLYLAMTMAFGMKVHRGAVPLLLGGVFLFFSGADIVGKAITGHEFGPPLHFEWWRQYIAINSIVTNLYWAPQHAVAGLISTFMVLRNPRLAMENAGIILAATAVWSPFSAVGLIPVFAWAVLQAGVKSSLTRTNIFAAPILLASAGLFLTKGSAGLPAMFMWHSPHFTITSWLVFVLLEFVLIALALVFVNPRRKLLVILCAGFILCLSLIYLGGAGDLLLRASIPSLAILAVLSAEAIVLSPPSFKKAPLTACLALGAVTPLGEIARGVTSPRLPDADQLTILQAIGYRQELLQQYLVFPDDDATVTAVLESSDFKFVFFGTAQFDSAARRVESAEYTDAALVTQQLVLPAGFYRLEAVLDWDVQSEDPTRNAGHVSLHGKTILVPIMSSEAVDEHVAHIFEVDGSPFNIAIGLGGWSKGKGFVQIRDIKISVTEMQGVDPQASVD